MTQPLTDNVPPFAEGFGVNGDVFNNRLSGAIVDDLIELRQAVGFNAGQVDGTVVMCIAIEAIVERGAAGAHRALRVSQEAAQSFEAQIKSA